MNYEPVNLGNKQKFNSDYELQTCYELLIMLVFGIQFTAFNAVWDFYFVSSEFHLSFISMRQVQIDIS